VQIVLNCETRLCSQFLGPGDLFFFFLQSYGTIFYGSGSDRIGQSGGSREYPVPGRSPNLVTDGYLTKRSTAVCTNVQLYV
jgi:hypothetical protein